MTAEVTIWSLLLLMHYPNGQYIVICHVKVLYIKTWPMKYVSIFM